MDDLYLSGLVGPGERCVVMTAFGRVTFKNCRPGTTAAQLVRFADSFMRKRYERTCKAA